jgi:phosphohistidine phosphatase
MRRQLILMRHGHAEESRDDYSRRLTDAGRGAARRAGEALARSGFSPQRTVTSPAPRALETAALLAEACGNTGAVEVDDTLYLADEAAYLTALRRLSDELHSVVLVGHNPTLSALASRLDDGGVELRPAEYVRLSLELDAWQEL